MVWRVGKCWVGLGVGIGSDSGQIGLRTVWNGLGWFGDSVGFGLVVGGLVSVRAAVDSHQINTALAGP